MTRVDILIPNFDKFGAQKLAIMTANVWAKQYDVSLVVFSKSGPNIELVEPHVKIVELKSMFDFVPKIRGVIKLFSYSSFVRKNKTDIVMSFAPIMNWAALRAKKNNLSLKVIIQEHCFPTIALKDRQNMSLLLELLFRYHVYPMYNKSNKFIVISKAMRNDFINNFGIKPKLLTIVTNPVMNMERLDGLATEPVDDYNFVQEKKYIMGIGRLSEQKNFSKLLRIFKKVKEIMPDVELIILGDGSYRERLLREASSLGIGEALHLLGFKNNPFKYLARTDCFCLTSNWEGMPGVIAESMYCKTPVVANDCLSGPEEMIENGVNGFLVPLDDEDGFADCVIKVLADKDRTEKIKLAAREFAKDKYSTEKFFSSYASIMSDLNL